MKRSVKIPAVALATATIILIGIRILLSVFLGMEFHVSQLWDDNLMMRYAGFRSHFLQPTYFSLVKNMSFPLFIRVMSVTKLPLTVTLSLVWSVAAILTYVTIKRLLPGHKGIAYGAFVYVLFMPQAFEMWSGVRIYRNMIIAPFSLITLLLMIHLAMDSYRMGRFAYVTSVILGMVFTFTYYIKEDGLWLLCCLILGAFIGGINVIVSKERIAKKAVLLALPFILFFAGTLGYKAINYHYFGVPEINTRTGGEPGEFLNTIYSVESDYRSMYCWTPYDAIEKVFEASPTLKEHPELLEAILHTDWEDSDIVGHPIPGDHLGWILREALDETGLFASEKEVNDFFHKVNAELKEDFRNGKLSKDNDVIQIVSSAGGYRPEEMNFLFEVAKEGLNGAVLLKGYEPGLGGVSVEEIEESRELVEATEEYTNLPYLDDYSSMKERSEKTSKIVGGLFGIYRVVNGCLFVSMIGILLFGIATFLTDKRRKRTVYFYLLGSTLFLGISLMYDVAISWFSAFLFVKSGISHLTLNFYNISLPGLLALSYLLAIAFIGKVFETKLMKGQI